MTNSPTKSEEPILRAEFSRKLILYWNINSSIVFLFTIIGIPIGLIWFFLVGPTIYRKAFARLSCELYPRRLVIRRGLIFRVEKTIPLTKIQDLTFRDGPILRALDLCKISVETAGQSAGPGMAEADLTGIINATEFKEAVLSQRDALDHSESRSEATSPTVAPNLDSAYTLQLLEEIRDSLVRIESHLHRKN